VTCLAFIIALFFAAPWEEAESIDVRYLGPVNLKPFICQDITRSSLIERVCYDETNQHMVVRDRQVRTIQVRTIRLPDAQGVMSENA
jgi:hypothetical protein